MRNNMAKTQVCVVGGGASGMFAAMIAARNGVDVLILESNVQLGKKIYATGNGKCNLLNTQQELCHFHGEDEAFIQEVLSSLHIKRIQEIFQEIGIVTYARDGGYLYPRSEQAASVVNALKQELLRLKVTVCLEEKLRKLLPKQKGGFTLLTRSGFVCEAEAVILCTGGSAAPKTGSDGSGYYYAGQFGHELIRPVPALCQLCLDAPFLKTWAGARVKGRVSVLVNDQRLGADYGELLLTNYGISGIPVFQVSFLASKALANNEKVFLELDFFTEFTEASLADYWSRLHERYPQKTLEDLVDGMLPKPLLVALCQEISSTAKMTPDFFQQIASLWKRVRIRVINTTGFEHAQVSAGGLSTKDISGKTMESMLVSGLYFAGEILDCNGDCGGYNLQWAWTTGYLAGQASAERVIRGRQP